VQEFSLLHVVQTGSGVHTTSYPMGTGGFSPGAKRPGREADHSSSTNAEIKKMWIYTYTFVQGQLYLFTLHIITEMEVMDNDDEIFERCLEFLLLAYI
jgi:hypothetical protein